MACRSGAMALETWVMSLLDCSETRNSEARNMMTMLILDSGSGSAGADDGLLLFVFYIPFLLA